MSPVPEINTNSTITLDVFNSTSILTDKRKQNEEYDPFAYRDQVNGISTSASVVHLIKCSLGSGILAMPLAFKSAGLLFGIFGSILAGTLCTYCVHMLVKTSHKVCRDAKVTSLGFSETAEKVFEYGPQKLRGWSYFAKQFVDVTLGTTYFGGICAYTVFIATSFHDVINHDFGLEWNLRTYIALLLIPQLLLAQIRKIKHLVPFSAAANFFIVIAFAITMYYMFKEPLVFSDKPLIADLSKIPAFFTTALFAMEGIGTVMPVENAMKKPENFLGCPGVLNAAMFVVVGLYTVIGFFGYVRYGDNVLGSITLNLEPGSLVSDAAKILMAVSVFCSYGLLFYVPTDVVWRNIACKFSEQNYNIAQTILRVVLVVLVSCISAAVPNLGVVIGLVGSICFSTLGIFIPSVLETVYIWPNFGLWKWKLIKNLIIMMLSIFFAISGSYISIKDIVKLYSLKV